MGKIRVAKNEGHPVEPGLLIDQHGVPTRDPNVMYAEKTGALLPFGRAQGLRLAIVTELLRDTLSGGPSIQPATRAWRASSTTCCPILIDPARFAGVDWSAARWTASSTSEGVAARRFPRRRCWSPRLPSGSRASNARARASRWMRPRGGEILDACDTLGLGRARAEALVTA
jgi:LDH2 family malate/lactate/ureidoglycolate dehydrogenase